MPVRVWLEDNSPWYVDTYPMKTSPSSLDNLLGSVGYECKQVPTTGTKKMQLMVGDAGVRFVGYNYRKACNYDEEGKVGKCAISKSSTPVVSLGRKQKPKTLNEILKKYGRECSLRSDDSLDRRGEAEEVIDEAEYMTDDEEENDEQVWPGSGFPRPFRTPGACKVSPKHCIEDRENWNE